VIMQADNNVSIDINQVRQKMEDYRTTIQALQALVGLLTWDGNSRNRVDGSMYSFGRKMDTSATNKISPSSTITPDALIQRNGHVGYVVEAKKSLPGDRERWRKVVSQLEKYDDDLIGWWTNNEMINRACTVLLLEISRASDFSRYMESIIQKENILFRNPLAVVEFTRAPEIKEYLWLRIFFGKIEDEEVSEALHSGRKVPIEQVVGSFGEKKFYDSPPVTEYIMSILWQDIFNEKKSTLPFDEEIGGWVLEINLEEVTNDLQLLYGSDGSNFRDVRFPVTNWVREAMDAFVKLKLAERSSNGTDYKVFFKRIRGDIIERFLKHRELGRQENQVAELPEQLKLFDS